eukprot:362135-Chlamydomonas_euryale.AAC.2
MTPSGGVAPYGGFWFDRENLQAGSNPTWFTSRKPFSGKTRCLATPNKLFLSFFEGGKLLTTSQHSIRKGKGFGMPAWWQPGTFLCRSLTHKTQNLVADAAFRLRERGSTHQAP